MKDAHDKIAAGLEDAIGMSTIDPAVADAMGEVVASMMRRDTLDHYWRERAMFEAGYVTREELGYTGHYEGCLAEAEEMIRRLRKRGFDILPAEPTPTMIKAGSKYTKSAGRVWRAMRKASATSLTNTENPHA